MSLLLQNLIYIGLFIAAGIVILRCFKRFNLHVAAVFFAVLFGVLLLYVPFYFGGQFSVLISDVFFNDSSLATLFASYARKSVALPFVYVKLISLVSVLIAAVIGIAAIILSAILAVKVVEIVKKYISRRRAYVVCAESNKLKYPSFVYILNSQHIYKRLLHLLN